MILRNLLDLCRRVEEDSRGKERERDERKRGRSRSPPPPRDRDRERTRHDDRWGINVEDRILFSFPA